MAIKDDPRIREFQREVNAEIGIHVDYLRKGKCSSHDEYKRRVGIIAGLEKSLYLLFDVLKNYRDDDDD